MHTDIEGSSHLVGAIAYRRGNRANTGGQVFIGKGPALGAYLVQRSVPFCYRRLPEGRDAGAAWLGQNPFQLVRRQFGQQRFTQRGLKGWKASTDSHRNSYNLGYRHARDIYNVGAVKLGQR